MTHIESTSATPETSPAPETKIFQKLSKEELAAMTPHERAMYYFDRDTAKIEDDIQEEEKENEILFDMSFAADKGEMTEEKKQQFIQKLDALKRFHRTDIHGNPGPGAVVFVNALLRDYEAGDLPFGGNINVNNERIEEWKQDIEKVKKERQEYLDEKYSV
jgi:hypothetical protein